MIKPTVSAEFREEMRRIAYGASPVDSQDLPGVYEWRKFVDAATERMYVNAFNAGVQHAEEQARHWHFPLRESDS